MGAYSRIYGIEIWSWDLGFTVSIFIKSSFWFPYQSNFSLFFMQAHIYSTVVAYTAENPDEVSYDCGEDVEVIAKSNYGWWRIRCLFRY